jgi:hypothetical protein
MKINKYLIFLFFISGAIGWSSCSKMDDYKNLIEDGEITYPGKVDSVIFHPGKNRAELLLVLGSDPSVTKVKAYWGNKSDSAEIAVTRSAEIDTVSIIINDLQEGNYNFELYTLDNKGNISVVANASGTVYGEVYENSLLDRPVQSAACGTINWGEAASEMLGVEVLYEDTAGASRKIVVPNDESVTLLEDLGEAAAFEYRTMYLPDPLTIDTFYTSAQSVSFVSTILTTGSYEVLTENNTAHGWMPNMGQMRDVTQLEENKFSFILSTDASDAVPLIVNIDPETNRTSVELQEIGNFGDPWFMTAETVEKEANYVSPCEGIISLYLHIDNLDKNDQWGYFNVVLKKK